MELTVVATVMGVLVSGLSLLTGIVGAVAWLQAKTRKQYAAERDFNHLKTSYEQLTRNVEQLWRQMDENHGTVARQLDRVETVVRGIQNTVTCQSTDSN